jgi:hypothetical protein
MGIDWHNLDLHHYLMLGGGAAAMLALICYFLPVKYIKPPALVTCLLAGLAVGTGAGMLVMTFYGYQLEKPHNEPLTLEAALQQAGPVAVSMMPLFAGGGGAGRQVARAYQSGGRGGRGGSGGPKSQLAGLVVKLDQLATRPLTVELTPEQKKVVRDQIQGLLTAEELSDAEAQKRIDALLKLLEKDKATLEAAGYRWPTSGGDEGGRGGFGTTPPAEPANPFKAGENNTHLKSLEQFLSKK